ncbi:MAG TPA: 16S rRNA (guanine(966)-N(2))-methyltransferase RsmD [Miltoncostaeaceae bacterium]|nr:16S rRNA (guanine(966)-N(2))-methyltransferase RsmD [Miltoncostaeaceae bacterium]
MRIIAGEYRGRPIVAPAGRATRPTGDRVREALFSILGPLDGRDVLDLFAGSGALSFEALSRGARSATAVDRAPAALACIRRNARALGVTDRLRVVGRDWRAALGAEAAAGRCYGVLLVDPPYSHTTRILAQIAAPLAAVAAPRAVVVIEHAAGEHVCVPGLTVGERRERRYGDSSLTILHLGDPRP